MYRCRFPCLGASMIKNRMGFTSNRVGLVPILIAILLVGGRDELWVLPVGCSTPAGAIGVVAQGKLGEKVDRFSWWIMCSKEEACVGDFWGHVRSGTKMSTRSVRLLYGGAITRKATRSSFASGNISQACLGYKVRWIAAAFEVARSRAGTEYLWGCTDWCIHPLCLERAGRRRISENKSTNKKECVVEIWGKSASRSPLQSTCHDSISLCVRGVDKLLAVA